MRHPIPMSTVKPVPEGFHTVTPYLIVDKAAEVIDFIQRAFGAEVTFQMKTRMAASAIPKSASAIP
jgi:hypothetical protein